MILTLFITIAALSLVLVGFGYATGDSHYAFIGLVFLFVLAIIILNGNLQYESGASVNSTYAVSNGTLAASSAQITYAYTSWSDTNSKEVGWLMAIASSIGGFVYLYQQTKRGEEV